MLLPGMLLPAGDHIRIARSRSANRHTRPGASNGHRSPNNVTGPRPRRFSWQQPFSPGVACPGVALIYRRRVRAQHISGGRGRAVSPVWKKPTDGWSRCLNRQRGSTVAGSAPVPPVAVVASVPFDAAHTGTQLQEDFFRSGSGALRAGMKLLAVAGPRSDEGRCGTYCPVARHRAALRVVRLRLSSGCRRHRPGLVA